MRNETENEMKLSASATLRAHLLSACAAFAFMAAAPTAFAETPTVEATRGAVADNPLFSEWTAPFNAPPFQAIEPDHFIPAFEHAMALHNAEIDAIAANRTPASFSNTIVALERAGADLLRVQRTFSALASSATNDEIRTIQREMSPRLAAHNSAIALNEDLFARIDTLYRTADSLDLNAEQARVLERTHNRFVRAGAKLEGDDRARLAEITERLASLYTAFSQNVQKDAEEFTLVLKSDKDKAGLPDFVVSAAAQAGADRDMDGKHVITLARSSFEPFMTFSTRRDLREQVFNAWTNRGDNDNEFSNADNIREILQLRLE
ncbi:MAG: hypothetical protein AAFW68_12100, partial [Pseudomonadota bacterium]